LIRILVLAVALVSTPYGTADSVTWHNLLKSQCSSHHIDDWMPERNQDDLIDEFEKSLPLKASAKLVKAGAHFNDVCADAVDDGANSCEKIVDIHVLRKANLLRQFTTYACAQYTCSELADCERLKAHR
jgi:hypothetical protein